MHNRNFGEETARTIDEEVRRIIDTAHENARKLVSENREHLDRIAAALLERETISGADIDLLLAGEELPPQNSNGGSDDPTGNGSEGEGSGPGYAPVEESAAGTKSADAGDDEFTLEESEESDGTRGDGGRNLQ